ncbi:hypothetical protein EW026_g4771 [Hermanssonia centrifuga]|uniref:Protein BFR2 n=1 Tax=Hermanssonia centrifuga TaxID=98765 RepID=A0A4S4KH52_9APHY|nr:hypothetical protein EW026_g4771 [Hermanssonia centrifuga]
MSARLSLAQQIALLSEAAPTDFDPEDINPAAPQSDDESNDANPAATEHYVDVGPSTLRQLNHSLSDPKYTGRRVSRKQLEEDEEDEDIPSEAGNDELPEESGSEEEENEEDTDGEGSEDERNGSSRIAPQATYRMSEIVLPPKPSKRRGEEPTDEGESPDLASSLRATREQDRKKGKAVTHQMSLWDSLLDARIRLQKTASAANRLPLTSTNQPAVTASLNVMLEEAVALSEDLFTLSEGLLRSEGSSNPPPRKRTKLSRDADRDYSAELISLSTTASDFEAAYHAHLIQTLTKWSAKIQAVAPSVLLPANRSSFKSAMGGKAGLPGVVDVIDDTLRTDAEKLLARTRTFRGRAAEDDIDEHDENKNTEVFDDTDFYQQLLRDVIEVRGGGGEQGEQEWVRRQKASKAKRKKTVDTKASKGRKLRYEVHEKLQNFMVPIPSSRGAWHEEQIDELFASLLGTGGGGL